MKHPTQSEDTVHIRAVPVVPGRFYKKAPDKTVTATSNAAALFSKLLLQLPLDLPIYPD